MSTKAYRAANPDKIRAGHKKWRDANKEKHRAAKLAWEMANPEKVRASKAKYVSANPNQRKQHYAANSDAVRARVAVYRANNPEKLLARNARQRAQKNNATPSWLTKEDHHEILKFYTEAQRLKHHVDHIVPLKGKNVTGLHVPWNLQVLSPTENLRKQNRFQE
jgi:hypothetical protein